LQPFYLTVNQQRLFCTFNEAAGAPRSPHGVLLLPPFAEEMNQTRSFHAALGRVLAAAGLSVLSIDLSTTGDSSGEFRDASWDDWVLELRAAAHWLQQRVDKLYAVAVRSATLHVGALTEANAPGLARLSLIDPIFSGDELLAEFLRSRVVRAMFEGQRITLEAVRAQLAAGDGVEVSGYELAPALYAKLNQVHCAPACFAGLESIFCISSRTAAARGAEAYARQSVMLADGRTTHYSYDDDLLWANDRPAPPQRILDLLCDYLVDGQA